MSIESFEQALSSKLLADVRVMGLDKVVYTGTHWMQILTEDQYHEILKYAYYDVQLRVFNVYNIVGLEKMLSKIGVRVKVEKRWYGTSPACCLVGYIRDGVFSVK